MAPTPDQLRHHADAVRELADWIEDGEISGTAEDDCYDAGEQDIELDLGEFGYQTTTISIGEIAVSAEWDEAVSAVFYEHAPSALDHPDKLRNLADMLAAAADKLDDDNRLDSAPFDRVLQEAADRLRARGGNLDTAAALLLDALSNPPVAPAAVTVEEFASMAEASTTETSTGFDIAHAVWPTVVSTAGLYRGGETWFNHKLSPGDLVPDVGIVATVTHDERGTTVEWASMDDAPALLAWKGFSGYVSGTRPPATWAARDEFPYSGVHHHAHDDSLDNAVEALTAAVGLDEHPSFEAPAPVTSV